MSMDGTDVLYDIHEKLIKPIGKVGQPHCYKFRVTYHVDTRDPERGLQETHGEILLLQPRHPANLDKGSSWSGTLPEDSSPDSDWGWNETVADDLTGCCCSACHGRWHSVLHRLFGKFPFTSTFAQGFTPKLFHAYQNEGERAASAEEAVKFWTQSTS